MHHSTRACDDSRCSHDRFIIEFSIAPASTPARTCTSTHSDTRHANRFPTAAHSRPVQLHFVNDDACTEPLYGVLVFYPPAVTAGKSPMS